MALIDDLIAEQQRLGLTTGNVLNINALDVLDRAWSRSRRTDLDKQDEIERGDDYEVTPQQGSGGSR